VTVNSRGRNRYHIRCVLTLLTCLTGKRHHTAVGCILCLDYGQIVVTFFDHLRNINEGDLNK